MTIKQPERQLLLVDDEPGIRNVLRITLESFGYAVLCASDGERGLDLFFQHRPLLVITDIKMPGIDGIELLRRIKQVAPETEVIMITGHGDMALAIKSLQFQAADFITKPIDVNDLETAVQKASDRLSISAGIRDYMDDLELLVHEKDKELDESRKMVTIGQTIAGMSHAIKNMAGGLKGSAFVIEQGIAHENRDYLQQGWEMMKASVDKITSLSRDLLNYAKTSRLNIALTHPDQPAREAVELMSNAAHKKQIHFSWKDCPAAPKIPMDSEAILNCLVTLITNAFDACCENEQISGEKDHIPSVEVDITMQNNQICYQVTDNGCGINPSIQSKIFNEFVTTKGMNGTGFGLMTAARITREHDGTIYFESRENHGACFTLCLPLSLKDKGETP